MIDKASKETAIRVMSKLLKGLSAVYDSDETSVYSPWDISADYKGLRVGMEVKNRENYDSDCSFMDGINSCEEYKVVKNQELVENGVFDSILLISIYRNGIMRISNMMSDYELDVRESPSSTYWNPEKRKKRFANFRKYKEVKI